MCCKIYRLLCLEYVSSRLKLDQQGVNYPGPLQASINYDDEILTINVLVEYNYLKRPLPDSDIEISPLT